MNIQAKLGLFMVGLTTLSVATDAQVVPPASLLPLPGIVWTGDVNPGQAACRADMPTTFVNTWHINATGSPPNYLVNADGSMTMVTAPIPVTATAKAYIATNTAGVWSSVLTTYSAGQTIPTAGLGTLAAPFNSLPALYAQNSYLAAGYQAPLMANAIYRHVVPGVGFETIANNNPALSPIQPGDLVLLAGEQPLTSWVTSGGALTAASTSWITIGPEPGQTPIVDRLLASGLNLVHFLPGIRFGSHTTQPAVVLSGLRDIVLEGETIADDPGPVDSFTPAFATANFGTGYDTVGGPDGTQTACVSFTGGHIYNILTGATLNDSQSVFENNEIDHFWSDALDHSNNRTKIDKNFIHDGETSNPVFHYDAIQQFLGPLAAGSTYNQYDENYITENRIYRELDANLAYPDSYLQGITLFDSAASHLYVVQNVIASYSCYGIGVSSAQNSVVAYNTIADDTANGGPANCAPIISVGVQTHQAAAPVTSNLLVIGNVTPGMGNASQDPTVVLTNNVVAGLGQGVEYFLYVNGVATWYGANAKTGPEMVGGNLLLPANEWTLFTNYAPSSTGVVPSASDLHLIPGSPAALFGQLQPFTPSNNQLGVPRIIAPGAY